MVIFYLGIDNIFSYLYDSFLVNFILFGQSGQEFEFVFGSDVSVMVVEMFVFGLQVKVKIKLVNNYVFYNLDCKKG